MHEEIVSSMLFYSVILIVFTIICIIYIVRGKSLIQLLGLEKSIDMKYESIFKIIILVVLIFFNVVQVVPCVRDIPNIQSNNFIEIEATALHNSTTNRTKGREMKFSYQDSEVRVRLYGYKDKILEGDQFMVAYLPYSKYGYIIEKLSVE